MHSNSLTLHSRSVPTVHQVVIVMQSTLSSFLLLPALARSGSIVLSLCRSGSLALARYLALALAFSRTLSLAHFRSIYLPSIVFPPTMSLSVARSVAHCRSLSFVLSQNDSSVVFPSSGCSGSLSLLSPPVSLSLSPFLSRSLSPARTLDLSPARSLALLLTCSLALS